MMPFVYSLHTKTVAENFTTSGTANTEIDAAFIKPGASRVVMLLALRVLGKGAGLSTLSGIAFRLKVFPTTASSLGTALTPNPVDNRAPAAVHTAGAASAGVTSGTGTAVFIGGCGCGAAGPGGWAAMKEDAPPALDGGANKSMDVFAASGTVSLNYEFTAETQE